MEISQLCKSTYNNQLQQSISLRLPRYAWTIHYTSNQGRVQNYLRSTSPQPTAMLSGLKRLRPRQSVCSRSCKTVIHAHFTQLNYDLHVFDIVQSK